MPTTTETPITGPLVGTFDEYPLALATRLASRFALPGPLEAFDFTEKGNINLHTFSVLAGRDSSTREYLLQRINHQVFFRPRSVMAAMIASINAQAECLRQGMLPPGEEWEAITLIPTTIGSPYLELCDRHGVSVWRLMERIPDTQTFKSLGEITDANERLRIAEEAGRGLARYGDFTADMNVSGLENPLPGYRDTRNYYAQFHAVLQGKKSLEEAAPLLPEDEVVRQSTQEHFYVHCSPAEYERRTTDPDLQHYISLVKEQEVFGTTLLRAMESGQIRQVAIHGDTKLDNFLFSTKTGRVKALVDLDTIMPHTWLADWGDTIRSLVNVAGEKEPDLAKIQVDMDVFRAVARGFLSTARRVTDAEVALMVPAVQILTLELGVRFLADYLRGDSYFRLGPADPRHLNKTRAMVQLRLFEKLKEKEGEMRAYIEELRR
jgi:hypothetical protein